MEPSSDPSRDPGWREALGGAAWVLLPAVAIRRQRRLAEQGRLDRLVGLRRIFVTFSVALPLIGVVVLFVWLAGDLGTDLSTAGFTIALVVLGMLALALTKLVDGRLDCSGDEALAVSYQRRFFAQVAFAEAAALGGFVGFILTGNPLLYVLGLAFTAVGFWKAAPTAANLARDQDRLRAEGCGRSLIAALRTPTPPPR